MSRIQISIFAILLIAIAWVLPSSAAPGRSHIMRLHGNNDSHARRYCGKHLSDALKFLCNIKNSSPSQQDGSISYKRKRRSMMKIQTKSIFDECCINSCSFSEMTEWCPYEVSYLED